jgi:hypothetical protein
LISGCADWQLVNILTKGNSQVKSFLIIKYDLMSNLVCFAILSGEENKLQNVFRGLEEIFRRLKFLRFRASKMLKIVQTDQLKNS